MSPVVSQGRPWMLVGPWYRWNQQGLPARETHPALQKFASASFVPDFLDRPQHSLKFLDEDWVYQLGQAPILPALPAPFAGLKRRFSEQTLVRTGVRKMFLTTHHRFYLVVCELHCDGPGFPSVKRDEACEAGFVVRRHRVAYPDTARRDAAKILGAIAIASRRLAALGGPQAPDDLAVSSNGFGPPAGDHAADPFLAAADVLHQERLRLWEWAASVGVVRHHEAWVPGAFSQVGDWADVEEKPASLAESTYPLYPVIPDPGKQNHAGTKGTLFFGVLPTGSADHDASGAPRYDDQHLYEIRCYVRRHDPRCPKRQTKPDCHGPLVWSRPTEPYRLASHFDLVGTANQPVTIQLPDVPALQAQAAALPASGVGGVGGVGGVRMVSPPGSSFQFESTTDGSLPKHGSMSDASAGGQICSFAIPLITIVATFVLNLFLPILMFMFGLWWMLKLKFCIPPSLTVAADLNIELALIPPRVDLKADIDVQMTVGESVALQNRLQTDFNAEFTPGPTAVPARRVGNRLTSPPSADNPEGGYTNQPLLELHRSLAADYSKPENQPSLTERLQYEDEVTPAEVHLR